MRKKTREASQKGFTLIELMIVIAIIGILAAIAVPNFLKFKEKSYDASANHDIRNAYTAAQNYFNDYDQGIVTEMDLQEYGYKLTRFVTISIDDGTLDDLSMTTTHSKGTKTYSIDASGHISF